MIRKVVFSIVWHDTSKILYLVTVTKLKFQSEGAVSYHGLVPSCKHMIPDEAYLWHLGGMLMKRSYFSAELGVLSTGPRG